jgi:hypothetical protein
VCRRQWRCGGGGGAQRLIASEGLIDKVHYECYMHSLQNYHYPQFELLQSGIAPCPGPEISTILITPVLPDATIVFSRLMGLLRCAGSGYGGERVGKVLSIRRTVGSFLISASSSPPAISFSFANGNPV